LEIPGEGEVPEGVLKDLPAEAAAKAGDQDRGRQNVAFPFF
jgi:hypothetical protein